jgi:Tol biopolymer transport system component/serine/threonine protein kinase
MQAERWKQIDEVFDAALERDAAGRASFLDEACAADADLRREVESLLAAYDRAATFIEAPALELAARGLAADGSRAASSSAASPAASPAGATVGRVLGPYRVLSLIGAGGMGEVYLARDTRLGRQVALKILPAVFTRDPQRVSRFEREARAASALSHPNIVTIYEVGEAEGAHFIATEYVEGRTLRRVIAGGAPAERETLEIAGQIAEALAAAHAAGIVHRDIKPENVMLRADGYVKVLDFGLAKLVEPSAPGGDDGAGNSAGEKFLTEAGAVMGTAAYMSPEQALGRELDQRTDIFSLGVVLYELATGLHPFKGATPAATSDAVLNRDPPPPSRLNPELPPRFDRIIARALEKDRELRYQTVNDLRAELKRLLRALDAAEHASHGPALLTTSLATPRSALARRLAAAPAGKLARVRKLSPVVLSLAALALVAFVALSFAGYKFFTRRAAPAGVGEGAVAAAAREFDFTRFTDRPGVELFPSFEPRGAEVAYASRADGDWDIYVQRVGGENARNLTGDSAEDDTQPAYSPDGARIAFRSERQGGGIFVMGATGESARRLTDFGFHPSWSPDGARVAVGDQNIADPSERRLETGVIWVIDVATGARRQLTAEAAGDAAQPAWSPTGARIAYWGKHRGGQRDLWTIPAAGGAPTPVTQDAALDWNPVWSPDGQFIYFASDRGGSMNLWRVRVEEATGRVAGQPESVTTPSTYAQHVSFSRDGRRAAYVNLVSSTNIYKAAFNPYKEQVTGAAVAVTQGFKHTTAPDLSPDGGWFAYGTQGEKQEDIYVVDRDGALPPRRLTDDAAKDRNPRWSPDGERVAFYSDRSGKYEIWTVRRDGSDLRQLTHTAGQAGLAYPVWLPDGARLSYNQHGESCAVIDTSRAWGEQTPQRVSPAPDRRAGPFWGFSWSSDGRKLAGAFSSLGDAPGLAVYDFAAGSFDLLAVRGGRPQWLFDDRRLLFPRDNKLLLIDTATRREQEIFSAAPHALHGYGLSKDGRLLYYGLARTEADIWLLSLE